MTPSSRAPLISPWTTFTASRCCNTTLHPPSLITRRPLSLFPPTPVVPSAPPPLPIPSAWRLRSSTRSARSPLRARRRHVASRLPPRCLLVMSPAASRCWSTISSTRATPSPEPPSCSRDQGVFKVYAIITHGLFSGDAIVENQCFRHWQNHHHQHGTSTGAPGHSGQQARGPWCVAGFRRGDQTYSQWWICLDALWPRGFLRG